MGEVPLFIMAMNRPVRSRMQGGVGRAGEKLALTRFRQFYFPKNIKVQLSFQNIILHILDTDEDFYQFLL